MTAITFQTRVQPWLLACFGAEIAADRAERNHRFLEESLELVQSCGCTASEAHQLVDYVFGRPVGEPAQEAGGVMVTLAALCLANSLDMHEAGETELARIWTKVEAIRAKQAAKPKHSPLPAAPAAVAPQGVAAWMHPETLDVISDAKKHEMSTQYGTETRRKAEGYSVAMAPVEQSAAAPALEAPAHHCCNSWFLSLPEGRQAVLRENQWMLADAAYQAGRESRSALEAPAAPQQGFITGKPSEDVEVAWLLVRSLAGDGEGGSDEADTVVLALRGDDEQWFVAGDWRANSTLESVHDDGGWIVGWMPYEVPAARLAAAPQAPAAPAVDASDVELLDFLQQTATAVEVLAQDEGEPPRFLVNRAISKDVRCAIRLARGKALAAQAKEGGA